METRTTDRAAIKASSARVTGSNLDTLVPKYFASLELTGEGALINALDDAKQWLNQHWEKLDGSNYDPAKSEAEIRERVAPSTLQNIQDTDGNRFVALNDQNQLKFNTLSFKALTQEMARTLSNLLEPTRRMRLFQSGRNWYPPRGYMGWHTNSNVQGFRLYCSHAEESAASFFRYQDPESREIETLWDKKGWNFRCFRTDLKPLWHCVYSKTNRISFGYGLQFPAE